MNFPCDCPACGCANPVDFSEIGRRIYCRGCGTPMVVPAPMEVVGPAAPPPAIVKFRCAACRRKFATRADLADKKIRCNRCGAGVRVPSADGAVPVGHAGATSHSGPVPIHAATGAPTRPGSDDAVEVIPSLFDDLESIQGIDQPRHAGAVLPSRSETMEEVRRQSEEEAAANREKAEKVAKKKQRRKKSGYFDAKETLKLVAGVGALVVVLALVAWGYPDLRFPLGGLLCVLGFINYLLGITSLRQQVAEEGVFAALLFRFFRLINGGTW
jgi:DNA-directed RNA polymerase subunit RPC12/RpoP